MGATSAWPNRLPPIVLSELGTRQIVPRFALDGSARPRKPAAAGCRAGACVTNSCRCFALSPGVRRRTRRVVARARQGASCSHCACVASHPGAGSSARRVSGCMPSRAAARSRWSIRCERLTGPGEAPRAPGRRRRAIAATNLPVTQTTEARRLNWLVTNPHNWGKLLRY